MEKMFNVDEYLSEFRDYPKKKKVLANLVRIPKSAQKFIRIKVRNSYLPQL